MSEWSKSFSNPHCAEQLFVEMYAENSRMAFWYAKINPKVFGETNFPDPSSFPTSRTFKLTAAEIARIRPEKSFAIHQTNEREIER